MLNREEHCALIGPGSGGLESSDLVVSACLCVSPVLPPGSGQGMVLYVVMECSQMGVNVLEPCFAIIITRK